MGDWSPWHRRVRGIKLSRAETILTEYEHRWTRDLPHSHFVIIVFKPFCPWWFGRPAAVVLEGGATMVLEDLKHGTVLSDLSGVTGMNILRSIMAGERDGNKRAEFGDARVKASPETIAKSLEGTWRPEQLAILRRQLTDWDHVQQQIRACDRIYKR